MKKSKFSKKPDLVIVSSDPLPPPSLYPRPKGLILHSGVISSDYKENFCVLKNKRAYYQTIDFCSQFYVSSPEVQKLSQDIKLQKYVRSLKIQAHLGYTDRFMIHTWQKLTQVNKIHIDISYFNWDLSRAQKQNIQRLFRSLNQDVTSMNIKFRCPFVPRDERISFMLEQLLNLMGALTKLTRLSFHDAHDNYYYPLEKLTLTEYPAECGENLTKKMQKQMSRLTKIESFAFINSTPYYYPPFNVLFYNLHSLKHLQNLEICNIPARQLKSITDKLKQTHFLPSITFYQRLEPQDALYVASSIQSLQKLTIRNDWHFDNKAMPILQTLQPGDINVTSLHLDFPLPISSKEDTNFILGFLSPFQKLESLYLYIQSDLGDKTLFSGLNNILRNNPLQELVLGLALGSGVEVSQALEQMIGITTLRKLSLTIKLYNRKEWKTGLKFICPSLQKLLNENKDLREFELFIEKVSSKFLEQMRELFKTLSGLDSLTFAYSPFYKWNRRAHATLLQELEQMLTGYNTSEKIAIQLQYLPTHDESCETWKEHLASRAQMGGGVREFVFMSTSHIKVPFFNEYL